MVVDGGYTPGVGIGGRYSGINPRAQRAYVFYRVANFDV